MGKPNEWTHQLVARLGIDTNTRIADKLNISVSAVAQRRKKLGIKRSPLARLEGRIWTPAEDALLGTMTDREVARELDISRSSVERRRIGLGIPGFDGRGHPRRPADLTGAR
jgi:DNA-binding CsgD family transcriptional regulator